MHAIGKGCLIAEIQESSNITYRLYDYGRVDKKGRTRSLHIDKALDVVNLKSSLTPKQPMRVLRYRRGIASELLARCKYFQVERVLLNSESFYTTYYKTDSTSFHALLCTEGSGALYGEEFSLVFFKGDCIFVPADSIVMRMQGKAQLLDVGC